jgi:uncharacterized protein involved in exopolysaccharide biosynthesis
MPLNTTQHTGNEPSVIVFGGDHHNTLGVIRALGKSGVPFSVLIHDTRAGNPLICCRYSRYIQKNLAVVSNNETEILQIKYDDTSPEKAQKVLEILLANAQKEITRVINGCQLSVIDYADVPVDTSYPNVEQNTFIGFFLGIVFGIAVVFFRELFDTRIKDEEDLKNKYGVPVLGMIPNLDVE